jgi:hypothetical protein
MVKCKTCNEVCTSLKRAEQHCQTKRFQEHNGGWTCTTCLLFFKTETGFTQHSVDCKRRVKVEIERGAASKKAIVACLSAMPGMALFGARLHGGQPPPRPEPLERIVAKWLQLDVEINLFECGFGSPASWKELSPTHTKPWVEVVLLVVLWHLGADKVNFFQKGDADHAEVMLTALGCHALGEEDWPVHKMTK